MVSIWAVVTLVITKTLVELSNSKTEDASIFWGLSPIFTWAYNPVKESRKAKVSIARDLIYNDLDSLKLG
jgi:hypothetical protein